MAQLLGLGPNEVPTNADLGGMAYQDPDTVQIENGRAALDEYQKTFAAPKIRPSLNLLFNRMETLDPRITFTRASDASAYEGDVAKAEENLLTYSEQFDNAAWNKTNSTIAPNTFIAPNGTTSADTLTANASPGILRQAFTALATPYVFSVWLYRKTGTGVVNISVDGTTLSPVAVTGAWQRFSTVLTPAAGTKNATIRLEEIGDEVYVWGAQLEQRSTLTDYQRTTDRIVQNYVQTFKTVTSNIARFKEIDPVTRERKGILIEEARTNLVLRSNEFDNAAWVKSNSTIQFGVPGPFGSAFKLVENTANAQHLTSQGSITVVGGSTYAISAYVKPAERRSVRILIQGQSDGYVFNFDTLSATILGSVSSNPKIEILNNGWFRASFLTVASGTPRGVSIELVNNLGQATYTGDGYSGIYISQAQLEAGSFATSPILTTAASATRALDACSVPGAVIANFLSKPSDFSVGSEFYKKEFDTNPFVIGNTNSTFGFESENGFIRAQIRYSGNNDFNGPPVREGALNKALFTVQSDKVMRMHGNGQSTTNTINASATLSIGANLFIGSLDNNNEQQVNECIKAVSFYDKALTEAQGNFLTRNTAEV